MTLRFEPGAIVATPAALDALSSSGHTAIQYLRRHLTGDWGELCEEDKCANEHAVKHGNRILSAYRLNGNNTKIWIITEADRSSTTILLPDEY